MTERRTGQRDRRRSSIDALLCVVRDQLGMDVAFLSKFDGGDCIFRNLQTLVDLPIGVGFSQPVELSYCRLIDNGELAEVTKDAAAHPLLAALPLTAMLAIRAYIAVPMQRSDGQHYGTLSAFSQTPDHDLRPRDAETLRVLAGVIMELVEDDDRERDQRQAIHRRIINLQRLGGHRTVYQPVVSLDGQQIVGMEALSRFPPGTPHPAQWFTEAARAGIGIELELMAISNAVSQLDAVPGFLALNASPTTICSQRFHHTLNGLPLTRLVVEITEHVAIGDYRTLLAALQPLRQQGLRVAVDDAGAGFASLQHVLHLTPDLIKLDLSLVRNIDTDPHRQALAAALAVFAAKTGASVIAEGIETPGRTRLPTPPTHPIRPGLPPRPARPTAPPGDRPPQPNTTNSRTQTTLASTRHSESHRWHGAEHRTRGVQVKPNAPPPHSKHHK